MSLALGGSNIYSTNLNSGAVNRAYFGVVVVHGKLPEEEPTPEPIYDYYVSELGDGVGTEADPMSFAESQTTINSMTTGQSIAYKGGDEFFGQLTLTGKSGITITSYGTGQATIKGSKSFIGWIEGDANIWEISTGADDVYNTFKNDVGTQNARIPNLVIPEDSTANYLNIDSVQDVNTIFTCTDLIGAGDLVGATFFIDLLISTRSMQTISAFNNTTGQVTLAGDISATNLGVGDQFWIQNAYDLLDEQDEWYYDSGVSKLYMYSVGTPTGITATTNNSTGVTVSSSHYVTLDNLIIRDFGDRAIYNNNSDFFTVNNCELAYTSGNGVRTLTSDDGIYTNNHVHNMPASGFKLENSDRTLIEDNLIEEIAMLKDYKPTNDDGMHGVWLNIDSEDNIIRYNTITDIGFNGVYSSGSKGFIIDKNFITNCGLSQQDGGSIYAHNKLGDGSTGTITNNIIIGFPFIDNARNFNAIYNDDDAHDITVSNNSLSGNPRAIYSHNNINMSYDNNNAYKQTVYSIYLKNDSLGQEIANVDLDGNEIYIENASDMCLRITNNLNSNYNMGTFNNNKYFNTLSADSVAINVSGDGSDNTIAEWQTKSSEDALSIDDSAVTITDSYFAYNKEKTVQDIAIPAGTWYDLDDNNYTGTITLQSFTSKILIQN